MNDARVLLWGRDIGAASWLPDRQYAVFQYDPAFAQSGIQVAPVAMPLREAPYEFPALARETFHGLPGLLADSLPDRFGSAVIDAWLAARGRAPETFHPIERLCYIGSRGMGALEFEPAARGALAKSSAIEVAELVDLANRVFNERRGLEGKEIEEILRVGTSAGGARAKAIVAWNEATGEFRSGQVAAGPGFTYWILKFDGVAGNRDKELADPSGYGLIEYAYHLMARAAGIVTPEARVLREGGRAHFMSKRFDRTDDGGKIHMQSLGALTHSDLNRPGEYSYEQALQTVLRLGLPQEDAEQQFRRAVFNVIARNQDDHVKNIAFLMDRAGKWRLSPAFDVVYSYNPAGPWTSRHQTSLHGKRDGFDTDDLLALGAVADMKAAKARRVVAEVDAAVGQWRAHAAAAGVTRDAVERIEPTFRRGMA